MSVEAGTEAPGLEGGGTRASTQDVGGLQGLHRFLDCAAALEKDILVAYVQATAARLNWEVKLAGAHWGKEEAWRAGKS